MTGNKITIFLTLALLCTHSYADTRVFNNSLVYGFYGHFFEIVEGAPTDKPCSRIIRHINEGTAQLDGSVSISHDDILHSGQSCSTGEMVMTDTPSVNPVSGIGQSDSIYENLLRSTGFWVGKSTRSCGNWELPNPTAVFMIFVERNGIIGPYDFPLPKGSKYIIMTNDDYTCVYKQIPKPTPAPAVATREPVAISNGGDNETYSAEVSYTDGDTLAVPVTVIPGEPFIVASLEPSPEDDGESVCFPGESLVELEDGTIKNMFSLSIGDRVRVGPSEFSEVFMFTHKLSQTFYSFIRVQTDSSAITLTKGHYLYVNGLLATAGTVVVGDTVELATGDKASVIGIEYVTRKGLFNPQTINGNIVVNNIRASTYTMAVEPAIAHRLLVPLRAIYSRLGYSLNIFESSLPGSTLITPKGSTVY